MSWVVSGTYKGAAVSDADAQAYLRAVEAADNQGPLEQGVQQAVNQFVIGCKADGIWAAIKASCILAGARTLNGALVPLVGAAPTNFNFVSGDYNRKTGLVGDGSTKYLSTNRNNNADPQNSKHISVYASATSNQAGASDYIGAGANVAGGTRINTSSILTSTLFRNNQDGTGVDTFTSPTNRPKGLYASSRASASSYTARVAGLAATINTSSAAPSNQTIEIYRRTTNEVYTNARLAFYSIGESLDLALLDARVTTLVNAFAAAIP